MAEGSQGVTEDRGFDDGAARHLTAGVPLPDLGLPNHRGDTVNLSTRQGAALLYLYPWTGRPDYADPPGWDDIPGAHGSTPETEGFRDHYLRFRAQRIEVFGLSSQTSEHHAELASRLAVPFQLLSDAAFAYADALRLPTFEAGSERFYKRLTLFVRDGRIVHVFYPVEQPGEHARAVLGWLDEKRQALSR
jgi:peroxiredoxin